MQNQSNNFKMQPVYVAAVPPPPSVSPGNNKNNNQNGAVSDNKHNLPGAFGDIFYIKITVENKIYCSVLSFLKWE